LSGLDVVCESSGAQSRCCGSCSSVQRTRWRRVKTRPEQGRRTTADPDTMHRRVCERGQVPQHLAHLTSVACMSAVDRPRRRRSAVWPDGLTTLRDPRERRCFANDAGRSSGTGASSWGEQTVDMRVSECHGRRDWRGGAKPTCTARARCWLASRLASWWSWWLSRTAHVPLLLLRCSCPPCPRHRPTCPTPTPVLCALSSSPFRSLTPA
jgi:hypothetical protein